jgi:predicted protein tyrosine phosphatase
MITLSNVDWSECAVTRMGATHLVSLLSKFKMIRTPDTIRPENHLKLEMDDIIFDMAGLRCPDIGHIHDLLNFGENLAYDAELVVHCAMGRSRSSAAVIALLAQRNPNMEHEVVELVFSKAPYILPNSLIIEMADSELQCGGRLIRAVNGLPGKLSYTLNGFVSFPFILQHK